MCVDKKPVQLKPVGKQGKREQIWAQIRIKKSGFTVNDLYFALKFISRDAIRAYVNSLIAADFIVPVTNQTPVQFILVKDCGVEAPRVRPDGTIVTLGERNQNMWRTMKILKTFYWKDVCIAASTESTVIAEKNARAYVETLAKAGYLRKVGQSEPGVRVLYRLVRNTGPQAPVIKRGGVVYDPNLDQIVYSHTSQVLDSRGYGHE